MKKIILGLALIAVSASCKKEKTTDDNCKTINYVVGYITVSRGRQHVKDSLIFNSSDFYNIPTGFFVGQKDPFYFDSLKLGFYPNTDKMIKLPDTTHYFIGKKYCK